MHPGRCVAALRLRVQRLQRPVGRDCVFVRVGQALSPGCGPRAGGRVDGCDCGEGALRADVQG